MSLLEIALCYAGRGWRIFPVHTTIGGNCSCGRNCGKDAGKHPRIREWQKHATSDAGQITRWWTKWPEANIGLATGSGLVIVDIDGEENLATLRHLTAEHGPLPPTLTAKTGRGLHLYFSGELAGSKTVEKLLVRGDGGYVLAPGSYHASGVYYQWVKDIPLSPFPDWFAQWLNNGAKPIANGLNLGTKPEYLQRHTTKTSEKAIAALRTPYNQLEEQRISAALAVIPASCQRDPWLHIGMALHDLAWQRPDGTDAGFELWDRWSATCPEKYSLHDVETRWRSFGKPGRAGITLGTLYHIASQHGWQPPAPRAAHPPAAGIPTTTESEVMPSDIRQPQRSTPETKPHLLNGAAGGAAQVNGHHLNGHTLPPALTVPASSESPLIQLNQKYSVIGDLGGKCMVMGWAASKVDPNVHIPSFQTFKSFAERYSHHYVETHKLKNGQWVEEPQQLGAAWLKWGRRVSYEGIDLVPGGPQVLPNGYYNLWQGFSVTPAPGQWSLMRAHIAKVLANHDSVSLEYIIKWAAWKLQNPGEPTEAALVFKGTKGAGKGTFARALRQLFGQHGLQIYNSKHLVGSFNGHFRNCCLLYADEAFWAGDKQGESTLMGLITEPTIPIEQKGIDVVDWKNHIGIVMTTNAEWVVPARHDERRYAVFQVSDQHSRDESYFKALRRELDNGGLAAMLHDLLRIDLKDWHPRRIPQTEALQQQKLRSLDPRYEWFEDLLQNGVLPTGTQDHYIVSSFIVSNMARESVPRLKDISSTALGRFLDEQGCEKVHNTKGNGWRFDKLAEHRVRWERRFGTWKWSYKGEDWIRK